MRKIVLFVAVFLIVVGGVVVAAFVAPNLVQTYIITPFNSVISSIGSGLSQLFQNPLAYAGSVVGSVAGTATLFSFAYKKAMQKKDEAQALLTDKVSTNLTRVTAIKDEQIAKLTDEVTALKTTTTAQLNTKIETMQTQHITEVNKLTDQIRSLTIERNALNTVINKAKEPVQIQVP